MREPSVYFRVGVLLWEEDGSWYWKGAWVDPPGGGPYRTEIEARDAAGFALADRHLRPDFFAPGDADG